MKNIYYVRIEYYDEYRDDDAVVCCVVIAKDYSNACKKACADFKYISKVDIEALTSSISEDCNVIYIDNDGEALKIIRENNDY